MPKYKISPLVFFEAHSESDVTGFIISHLEEFIRAGYKTICMEVQVGKTLETALAEIKRGQEILSQKMTELQVNPTNQVQMQKLTTQMRLVRGKRNFFEKLKQSRIDFQGIDMSVPKILKIGMDSPLRDQFLAKKMISAANQHDGGVIILVGFAHAPVTRFIAELDPEHAGQYHCYYISDSRNENQSRKQMESMYSNEGWNNHFHLSLFRFDVSGVELEHHFKKLISDRVPYESESLDTASLQALNYVTGEHFVARMRTGGEFYVDALLPIPKDKAGFLSRFSKTIANLKYEVQELEDIKGQLTSYIVVKAINVKEVAEDIEAAKKSSQRRK